MNEPKNTDFFPEINPDEPLNEIIERVKERYVCDHLKDKSIRRTAQQCGIARHMIARIAGKFESNSGGFRPNL